MSGAGGVSLTCCGSKKLVSTFRPVCGSMSVLSWTRGLVWLLASQMAVMLFSLTKETGRWGM